MKIAIDPNIPFILKPLTEAPLCAEVTTDLTPEGVRDVDAIITRTRTRIDAGLLDGSRCKFVATATIGTDHIDLDYCRRHGIAVANAPGCNAPAVAQWVLAAVAATGPLEGRTLGLIGAGNVGKVVKRWAEGVGMRVLVNDPPLQEREPGLHHYVTLADIAREADVITVHTPLTRTGSHPTYHLLGKEFISMLQRRPLVLNAARGPVADTQALIDGLDSGLISAVGIDCWEGEPDIDKTLLGKAIIATPHIAGYSQEGKIRATQMVLDALKEHFRLPYPLPADAPAVASVPDTITADAVNYDILADTARLKASHKPDDFEAQRNHYLLRREPV